MALKPVYTKPTPELPSWAKSPEAVKDFQDRAVAAGFKIKGWEKGKKPGYGTFGAQTAKAYESDFNIGRGSYAMETPLASKLESVKPFASNKFKTVGSPLGTEAVSVGTSPKSKLDLGSLAESVAPFASNLANMTRKPPKPIRGGSVDPVTLKKMDLSNERTELDRQTRGADLAAERSLSGNSAAAVRTANLVQRQRGYSDSYSREEQANTQIANQQTLINAQVAEKNTRTNDVFNQQGVEREIAMQNAASANIANASDKFVAMSNEKAKRELEGKNFSLISQLYKKSGVLNRAIDNAEAEGYDDVSNTGTRKKKRFGGKLKKAY